MGGALSTKHNHVRVCIVYASIYLDCSQVFSISYLHLNMCQQERWYSQSAKCGRAALFSPRHYNESYSYVGQFHMQTLQKNGI